MPGKHYIIATQDGYLDGEFHSKEAAVKALVEEVKAAAKACRQGGRRCSVVGSARDGSVEIKIGGRQGYHLWQRYVINERPGARKPPASSFDRELKAIRAAAVPSEHHSTVKSPADLDRDIAESLASRRTPKASADKSKLTREERALLVAIERDGPRGSVAMRGLNKAAKGLIAKGLGDAVGRIGGGHFLYATVKGSACLGIDWDNGPRPPYDERKGEYVISANGTLT